MTDWRDQHNTPLPIGAGIGFADWLKTLGEKQGRDVSKDAEDYDLQGAFLDALQGDERGHFPDTFKKPNHPTFSDESKYHGTMSPMGIPYQGGHWAEDGSSFQPSIIQQVLNPDRDLERYFREREPGVTLLPAIRR